MLPYCRIKRTRVQILALTKRNGRGGAVILDLTLNMCTQLHTLAYTLTKKYFPQIKTSLKRMELSGEMAQHGRLPVTKLDNLRTLKAIFYHSQIRTRARTHTA